MAWETVAGRSSQSYGRSFDRHRGSFPYVVHLHCHGPHHCAALGTELMTLSKRRRHQVSRGVRKRRTFGPSAMRHAYPSDGERRGRSTKGVLIEKSSTPDTISCQALHFVFELLPCSRRAIIGTDRLAGPPNSKSERTMPSKPSLFNVTSTRKGSSSQDIAGTSDDHNEACVEGETPTRHATNKSANPQAVTLCEAQGSKGIPKQKRQTLRCLLSLRVTHGVCNEVWWRPCPTILQPPFPVQLSLHWAYGLPCSLSCGRQVSDVGIPYYRDAKMQHSQSR